MFVIDVNLYQQVACFVQWQQVAVQPLAWIDVLSGNREDGCSVAAVFREDGLDDVLQI